MSVRMRHEGVEGEIEVAESAVPFHAAAGWQVIEDDSEQTAGAGADDSGEKPTSGRARASAAPKKKEQD